MNYMSKKNMKKRNIGESEEQTMVMNKKNKQQENSIRQCKYLKTKREKKQKE